MVNPKKKIRLVIPSNAIIDEDHAHIHIPIDTRTIGWMVESIIDDCRNTSITSQRK